MKIELDDIQLSLIIDGLRALQEAAEYENRATRDGEIIEGNEAAIREAGELIGYLAGRMGLPAPAGSDHEIRMEEGSCG